MRLILAAACALLIASAPGAWSQEKGEPPAAEIFQNDPVRAPGDPDALPVMPVPATASARETLFAGEKTVRLQRLSLADIARADEEARASRKAIPGPKRVGVVRKFDGGPLRLPAVPLEKLGTAEASTRVMAVQSSEAYGLRLHITGFNAAGGQCIVYSYGDNGELCARGPYTGKGPNENGDFWTEFLPGDTAYIEVTGSELATLEVAEIVHFDQMVGGIGLNELGCHLDVRCETVNTIARDAIGQMNFVTGGGSFVCSGTLLNDSDPETLVPYFLTAYHCISTQAEVNSLEVVWLWQRPSCGGALPTYANLPRSTGGTRLVTNPTDGGNDMCFIRLNSAPGGVGYAGWNTSTGSATYGIHHPSGSWKRFADLDPVGFCPGCLCSDPSDYDYYNMVRGLVEGGSSGSGCFNSSGQLTGQLYGRCSVCCDPDNMTCSDIDDFWAVYGEFETTYPLIRRWLEIGGTIHVNKAYPQGLPELGTPSQPYNTVAEGHAAAWNGARIKIVAGNYPENITLSKRVEVIASGGVVTIGTQ